MWQATKQNFLEATGRVVTAVARLLPSALAMLIIFALSVLIAFLVRAVVRRACERLGVDRLLREWGIARSAGPGVPSPSVVFSRVALWTVLILGLFLGLSALDTPAAARLSLELLGYVPRALVALAIVAAGLAAARVVERNVLIGAVNMGLQSARSLALGSRWLVVLFVLALGLEYAGVGPGMITVSFGILFGGIVLALSLAVGLGAKDLVARSLERRFPEPPPEPKGLDERGGQVRHL
jgi:hypothetical protein